MSIFKNGTVHSAESSGFSVPEILREINFRESRNSKTAIFAILGALKKVQKNHKNQISKPLNVLK